MSSEYFCKTTCDGPDCGVTQTTSEATYGMGFKWYRVERDESTAYPATFHSLACLLKWAERASRAD